MRKHLSLALENPGDLSHKQIDRRFSEPHGRVSNFLHNLADDLNLMPHHGSNVHEDLAAAQASEYDADVSEGDELKASLEGLYVLAQEARALVTQRQCTAATLRLTTQSANMQLTRIGEDRLQLPALESAGGIEAQHQQLVVALESAVGRLGQKFVLAGKRHWDVFGDFFATTAGTVRKYEARLQEAQKEFGEVKTGLPKGKHEVSLTELHYFFSTSNENWRRWIGATDAEGYSIPNKPSPAVKKDGALERVWVDLPSAIDEDVKISKYVLKSYPGEVIALLKQALSKIGKGDSLASSQAQDKLEQALAGLKHPADLFDAKLLKQRAPMFNMTGFQGVEGSHPMWADDDTPLTRLAQKRYVQEFTSFHHHIDKAIGTLGVAAAVALPHPMTLGAAVGTNMGDSLWAKNVQFDTPDIQRVIKAGEAYLQNVNDYFTLQKQMEGLKGQVTALWDLEMSEDKRMVAMSALTFLDNILTCFVHPARDEVGRALKGAKYCQYLALRMMHHAKHGN